MQKADRNYGIDLLKMISMLMIVMLHLLSHGQVMTIHSVDSWTYRIFSIPESFVYCAVDVFAMISGFLMAEREWHYRNILSLWGQVFFYSMGITIVFYLLDSSLMTGSVLIKSVLPVVSGHYWYFTAYFFLFFFIPFLNELMHGKGAKKLVLVCLILLSVIPTLTMQDPFKANYGYSGLWLVVCYLIGAYIRLYVDYGKISKKLCLAGYLVVSLLLAASKLVIQYLAARMNMNTGLGYYLLEYTSPLVIADAVFLLILFADCKVENTEVRKVIKRISESTFAVYLIHEHTLVRSNFIEKIGEYTRNLPILSQCLCFVGGALLIFVAGILIDQVRRFLFGIVGGICRRGKKTAQS